MIDPLSDWWVHTVTVEPYQGDGPEGPTFGAAYALPCFIDETRRLVRSSTGEQVVSSTTVLAPATSATVPPGSRVTLSVLFGGHATTVLAFARNDAGGQPTPNHVELSLA